MNGSVAVPWREPYLFWAGLRLPNGRELCLPRVLRHLRAGIDNRKAFQLEIFSSFLFFIPAEREPMYWFRTSSSSLPRMGFVRYPSIPAFRHRSRSPFIAYA